MLDFQSLNGYPQKNLKKKC